MPASIATYPFAPTVRMPATMSIVDAVLGQSGLRLVAHGFPSDDVTRAFRVVEAGDELPGPSGYICAVPQAAGSPQQFIVELFDGDVPDDLPEEYRAAYRTMRDAGFYQGDADGPDGVRPWHNRTDEPIATEVIEAAAQLTEVPGYGWIIETASE